MTISKMTKLKKFELEVNCKIQVEDVPEAVKKILLDNNTFIEQFNEDFGYVIFRNDVTKQEVIFTRQNSGEAYKYIEPSEFCNDPDRI